MGLLDWAGSTRSVAVDGVEEERLGEALRGEARFRLEAASTDTRHFKKRRFSMALNSTNSALISGLLSSEELEHAKEEAALSLPFKESSWHRVLAAEKLRRSLVPTNQDAAARIEQCNASSVASQRLVEYLLQHCLDEAKAAEHKSCQLERPSSDEYCHPILRDHRLKHDAGQRSALRRFIWRDMAGEKELHGVAAAENAAVEDADCGVEMPAVPPACANVCQAESVRSALSSFVRFGGGGVGGVDKLLAEFLSTDAGASAASLGKRELKALLDSIAVRDRSSPAAPFLWRLIDDGGVLDAGSHERAPSVLQFSRRAARRARGSATRDIRRAHKRALGKLKQRGLAARPASGPRTQQAGHDLIDKWLGGSVEGSIG